MAESVISICNSALLQIGEAPIISLDNPQGATGITLGKPTKHVLLNQFYPEVRDAVLRAHPWGCAIEIQQLSRLVTGPLAGFTYYFQLPSDPWCLRILELDDDEASWRIHGRKLACDNSTVIAKFIKRIEDPVEFDSLLSEAISTRIAARLAYPLAGSMSLARDMWDLYGAILREAKTIDGMEGTPDTIVSNQLTDVRL